MHDGYQWSTWFSIGAYRKIDEFFLWESNYNLIESQCYIFIMIIGWALSNFTFFLYELARFPQPQILTLLLYKIYLSETTGFARMFLDDPLQYIKDVQDSVFFFFLRVYHN